MRFYVESVDPRIVKLDKSQSRHALKVLRLKKGDTVTLFDGTGREAQAFIEEMGALVSARILKIEQISRESAIEITCASALPKGNRLDFMIQKLCEIGVFRFIPVKFSRSVAELSSAKLERLRKISTEACKQCGRNKPLLIDDQILFSELTKKHPNALLCSPKSAAPLLNHVKINKIIYVVGPEGGLTAEEDQTPLVHASLGATILRIETAVIYAACAISAFICVKEQ